VAIRLGSGSNFAANKIKLGSTSITKVYLGATQVWPVVIPGDYRYYWITGIIYRKSVVAGYTPSLIFSDSRNSQYLGAGGAN